MATPKDQTTFLRWCCRLKNVTDSHERSIVNPAIFIVLASFLFMASGCSYYKFTTKKNSQPDTFIKSLTDEIYKEKRYPREQYPDGNLAMMLFMDRDFYVFNDQGRWHLSNALLYGDTIKGIAQFVPVPGGDPKKNVEARPSKRYSPSKERFILKLINLYVTDVTLKDTLIVDIPVANITSCDIFMKDKKKTSTKVIVTTVTVVGGLGVIFVILFILAFMVYGA